LFSFGFRCLAMLAAFLCTMQVALASDIMVMNATARASLTPVAKTGAVYFSVMNHGNVDDRLLSITTPAATVAELHETVMEGDVMKMRAIEGGWVIEPGKTYDMKPGGIHVMLTGLKAPLKKGETIAFELKFENAGVVSINAPVGEIAAGHEHGD
jgi:periplasmic copper chaperone A